MQQCGGGRGSALSCDRVLDIAGAAGGGGGLGDRLNGVRRTNVTASCVNHPSIGIRVISAALLSCVACASGPAPHRARLVAAEAQPLGSLVVRARLGDSLVADQGLPVLRMTGKDATPLASAALTRGVTRFDGLPPGRYVFTVRRVAFAPERWVVAIRANCRAVLELQARPVFICFDNCPPAPRPPKPAARYDACASAA